MDELLDGLHGAAIFTFLDLQAGYWLIEIAEDDRAKTAFISHMGPFEFQVIPFGLMSLPPTFQRMSCVMAGECCLVYIDDYVVFLNGKPWGHFLDIIRVFERIKEAGLKLKGKNCFFAKEMQ